MSTLTERRDILNAFLGHAAFDGWTDRSLKAAARDTGRDMAEVSLLFPRGMRDLLTFFSDEMDRALIEKAEKMDFTVLKMRERITELVRLRLLVMERHREAARRAGLTMALPVYMDVGARTLAATVDTIWRLAGDTSTDWNYYTKRAILSGVYASTALTWFADNSPGYEDSWAFLDRRIADVMKIERTKARCREATKDMPSLARILGRLRHRDVIRPL